jgi:hypothetical protein
MDQATYHKAVKEFVLNSVTRVYVSGERTIHFTYQGDIICSATLIAFPVDHVLEVLVFELMHVLEGQGVVADPNIFQRYVAETTISYRSPNESCMYRLSAGV